MGLGSDGNAACHWRLRSPDDDSCYASGVTSDGGVGSGGIAWTTRFNIMDQLVI
jgi:hypothetical protein